MNDLREEMKPPATGPGARFMQAVRHPALRELLCYCLPALAIGLALRAAVMVSMPYVFIQYDSSDFLETTYHLLAKHQFHVNYRRAYLTPLLFSVPFYLPGPALITIAVAQHLMGLAGTVLVGALVRLWFRYWKVLIIPITALFAASPMIVWYEHSILGEAQYLFFALLAVLAGTLLARWPGFPSFGAFMVSVALVLGTRLEAKTFCLFALVVVVSAFWRQWIRMAICLGILAVVCVTAFLLGGGRNGSSLAYATLIKLAPDHSKSEPEIEPRLIPFRDGIREKAPDYPSDLVRIDKDVSIMVDAYVQEQKALGKRKTKEQVLKNLLREAFLAAPAEALILPWTKFRLAIDVWSAYAFDLDSLDRRQKNAATTKPWMTAVLSKGLTGQKLDPQQMRDWVDRHYNPEKIAWLDRYQGAWNNLRIRFRLPDKPIKQFRWVHDFYGGVPDRDHTLPGVPYFYIISFLGMVLSFFRPSPNRWVHIGWIATMLGGLYVASLIGVTNARYRFGYEIFFLLYFGLLLDWAAEFAQSVAARRRQAGEGSR